MNNELRWKQRYNNFKNAYENFSEIVEREVEELSDLEKEGFIQRFEYTFELAWKTLKDYLQNEGYPDVDSPRQVIRQAFQNEIIVEGEVWMQALKKRNLTSHTYNKEILNETINFLIDEFYPVLEKLNKRLKEDISK